MSKRKTINVAEVLNTVNLVLADSAYDDDRHQQYRMGMCILLEDILHKTGNYKGYSYLTQDEIVPDCRPGVRYENGKAEFVDTDETRRHYHF